jgi:hypothetical protein
MSSELTAGPELVGSPEDLRGFNESLEKARRVVGQFTKPLEQFARVFQQVGGKETVEQWTAVKPIYESAPPHEKRRLENMTIGQAFAFYSRRASSTSARAKNFIGGRVRAAARAPRRSIRSSSAKARAPGPRSGSDDPEPLKALPSSLASAGLFCVLAHAFGPPRRPSVPPVGAAGGGRFSRP